MELQHIEITRITGTTPSFQEDVVAVEAQYQVRLDGAPAFSFTCTPSHLEEMVTGALYSRKIITSAAQIAGMEIHGADISVSLRDVPAAPAAPAAPVRLSREVLFQTVNTLFSDPDTLFNRTGCAHCCALMGEETLLCAFEDIGRHNALDKVIGYALRHGIPMNQCVIFTSGRISGDYMAKIIHAGMPMAVSRAAVTSEAVRLAKAHNVTLYGFVRGDSANLYHP